MNTQHRSKLMFLSWEIQRRRKSSRAKALVSAWAIYLNEDIAVFHLIRKHSHQNNANKPMKGELALF